jgi:hypothetical protein
VIDDERAGTAGALTETVAAARSTTGNVNL